MNFRKFSFLMAFLLLTGGGYAFADANIGNITVKFCNDGNMTTQLNMVAEAGKASNICVQFNNNSIDDVMIKAGFIDGTITEDSARTKACQNEGTVKNFGQYVTFDTKPFLLPAGTSGLVRQAIMKFPSGDHGLIHGCLTYYISKSNTVISSEQSMFNILVRKANFVEVLLGGKLERNLIDTTSGTKLTAHLDPGSQHYLAELLFENKGNVIENLSLSGIISNKFGYSHIFTGKLLKVQGGDKGTFKIDMGTIPFYKGRYNIDITITSQPEIEFSVDIPAGLQQPLVFHKTLTVFFFPYMLALILIGLLIVIRLIKSFFSKFHLVAVSSIPPPPKNN